MTKSIKDMSSEEMMNLPRLKLEDTFDFRCKACGKCCKHRKDVILTPYDLFRIANHLGRTPEEIIKRYCHVYEGVTSHLPIVRMVPVPPDNACPFLRDRKCVIHSHKPVVCRVYPLARVYETDSSVSQFIYSDASCKHEPRTTTVREWIGDVATEEAEASGRLWGNIITELFEAIRPESLEVSQDTRKKILNVVFIALYLKYDTGKPFVSQLESNFEALKTLLAAASGDDSE